MSNPLAELLRRFPKCRVTIRTGKPRRQPREGDRKTVRGRVMVRQQVYSEFYRAWEVRRGRPVWEWVPEEKSREAEYERQMSTRKGGERSK